MARIDLINAGGGLDRWIRVQANADHPVGAIPAVWTVYLKLLERAHRFADALGFTPLSRSRLGLTTAAGFDLARELAEASPKEVEVVDVARELAVMNGGKDGEIGDFPQTGTVCNVARLAAM